MRWSLFPLVLATIGCGYKPIDSPSHSAVVAFQAAKPIPMSDPAANDQPKRAWDYTIKLPNGVMARVTASGWIGGRFEVQYSDESSPRIAGSPGDYVYPSSIRVSSDNQILFGLAQGYRPIGNSQVNMLFVYNLQRRELVQAYKLNQALIPIL